MKQLSTILLSILLLTACNKSDDAPYTKTSKEIYTVVKFENSLNEKMYADVYATAEDYKYSRNPIFSLSLNPLDTLRHTFHNLNNICYIDIYSESRVISNWCRWTHTIIPLKTTAAPEVSDLGFNHIFSFNDVNLNLVNFYSLCNSKADQDIRTTLINSNQPEKVWRAVDGPNWSTKTEDERFARLTLTKDLRFTYQWKEHGKLYEDTGRVYTDFRFDYGGTYDVILYADSTKYLLQKRDGKTIRLDRPNEPEYRMLEAE